jgi:hypothetical protein
MNFRKSPTEADLVTWLWEEFAGLPPLHVAQWNIGSPAENKFDALIAMGWRNRTYRFGVEARRLWTPKIISEAVDTVQRHVALSAEGILGEDAGEPLYPLILVPYLSEEHLRMLEAKAVSGIDLCGNGVIVVPDEMLVLRTGFPNRFRWEGTIKNVYRKNSSIVARVFLFVPKFDSVGAVLEEIRERHGEVALATVSKVCRSLEDDLIIERFPRFTRQVKPSPGVEAVAEAVLDKVRPRSARLLQPEKLLDLLAENYELPAVSRTFQGKCGLGPKELRMRLQECMESSGARIVLTGASSTETYAIMAREPVQSFYCSDIDKVVTSLGNDIRETDRFANVVLLETRDDFVYFDRRPNLVASPVQTYLELMSGDKRDRETADQVRRVILGQLAQAQAPRGEG